IKNYPSDGSERPVANAVLAISSAPKGDFGTIQIEPDNIELYFNNTFQFTVSGWDQYFNPYPVTLSQVQFWVDSSLGAIDQNGLFKATSNGGSGYVYATYQGQTDSAFVRIKAIKAIDLEPEFAVTDSLQPVELSIQGLVETGEWIKISAASLDWQLTNSDVGYIDGNLFYGLHEGETQVIAFLDTLSDTISVRVEIGTDTKWLDLMETLDDWQLRGENIDSLHSALQFDSLQHTAGQYSLQLDYQFTYSGSQKADFYLKKKIPVYGVPEQIGIDFKSDGGNHKIYFVVSDNDGQLFKTDMRGYLKDSTRFVEVWQPTSTFTALDNFAQFNYPIQIEYIWFRPGSNANNGETVQGSVYFDNLRVQYPTVTSLIPLNQAQLPNSVRLFPNFPNPFNPKTNIRFTLPKPMLVKVRIFDVRGRLVEQLLNQKLSAGLHQIEWQSGDHASGVYFCQLSTPKNNLIRKMVLIK
ncbi:MAG TPA: T9SS type A sorting domain-containing protein, partial [Caldithrix abyssi]|nr:T9SS type A sorting domain-containing protein [Caldithrix abyssi]